MKGGLTSCYNKNSFIYKPLLFNNIFWQYDVVLF
jgi:hypothetical protein